MISCQKGFIALYFTLLVVLVLSGVGVSAFVLISAQQNIIQNTKTSLQAYYGAEAGVEDALFRVKNSLQWSSPITLGILVSNTNIATTIESIGSVKTITATGEDASRIRKVEVIYGVPFVETSFLYGTQAGEGGIELGQNSTIVGNIYSNGSLKGSNGVLITGDAIVAGDGASGNEIKDIDVNGNAWAPSFSDCNVGGNIVFVTGGGVSACPAGGTTTEQADPIASAPLPITQSMIDVFVQEAQNGGIISSGDYTPADNSSDIIGPGVIQGDMILKNNQSITLAGTVYVQGNIDIDNGTKISLSLAYGKDSGVLFSDGWVHVKNNGELVGSGNEDSYLMVLSTLPCKGSGGENCTHHDSAIDIHNNASGAIFYASDGMIHIHNNVDVTQITAWKLKLQNGVTLTYTSGLANPLFSSGPGGVFELSSWKEVE